MGDLQQELVDALSDLGLDATVVDGTVRVDGSTLDTRLIQRAHPTPAGLAALVADTPASRSALVVADRISRPGREVLRTAGWGWLDRRGHLRVWQPGLRIETDVTSRIPRTSGDTANPWTTVGLEIALAALIRPDDVLTARHLAPVIGRSVGAVQELIGRFAAIGLVGPTTRLPLLPEMFWETAAHWPDDAWTGLSLSPTDLVDHVDVDQVLRVDERAAAIAGARIPAAGDMPSRFYIRSAGAFRRLHRFTTDTKPACHIRRVPVHWIPENPDHPTSAEHPIPLAHPIVCALRLGADPARGREIVEDWGIVPTHR